MAVLISQLGTPDKRDFRKLDSLDSEASTSNWSIGTLAAELADGVWLTDDALNTGLEEDDSTGTAPVASVGAEDTVASKLGKPKSK